MTPTGPARAWAGCPTCRGSDCKPGMAIEMIEHYGGKRIVTLMPCPTCAAHFKAVREAVEDFRRRAVGVDMPSECREDIRSLPIEADR